MAEVVAEFIYAHAYVCFVIPTVIEVVLGICVLIVPFIIGIIVWIGLFLLFEWAEAVHINNIYKKKGW